MQLILSWIIVFLLIFCTIMDILNAVSKNKQIKELILENVTLSLRLVKIEAKLLIADLDKEEQNTDEESK